MSIMRIMRNKSYLTLGIAVLLFAIIGCEDPAAVQVEQEQAALRKLEDKLASLSKFIEAELTASLAEDLKKTRGTKANYELGNRVTLGMNLQLEKAEDSAVRIQGDIERKHRVELAEIIEELKTSSKSAGAKNQTWVQLMIADANQLLALYDFRKAVKRLATMQHRYVPIQSNFYQLGMTTDRAIWHDQTDSAYTRGMNNYFDEIGQMIADSKRKIAEAKQEIDGINAKIKSHETARDEAIEKATDAKNQATVSVGEKYAAFMRTAIEQERIASRESGEADSLIAQRGVKEEFLAIIEGELSIRQAEYDKVKRDIAVMTQEVDFSKKIHNDSLHEAQSAQKQLIDNVNGLNQEYTDVIALFDQAIKNSMTAVEYFDLSAKSRSTNNRDAIINTLASAEAVLLGIRSQKATAMGKHATFLNMRAELGEKWGIPGAAEWRQIAETIRKNETEMLQEANTLVTKIQEAASQTGKGRFLTERDVAVVKQKVNSLLRSQQSSEIDTEESLRNALGGTASRTLGTPTGEAPAPETPDFPDIPDTPTQPDIFTPPAGTGTPTEAQPAVDPFG